MKLSLIHIFSSSYDAFNGIMIVNAGIEAKDYQKTMSLIKEQLEDIQNGNLSDNDIQIAKIMLQNALRKTNDEAGSMIALAYNRDITHKQETNDEYIQKLLNVSKEDIINVAKKVQLDTIFFLTGKDFSWKQLIIRHYKNCLLYTSILSIVVNLLLILEHQKGLDVIFRK